MYYPVMNVTQCEGQLSTYHLNCGSMTIPQSEKKIRQEFFAEAGERHARNSGLP